MPISKNQLQPLAEGPTRIIHTVETEDSPDDVSRAGYFNPVARQLSEGDHIYVWFPARHAEQRYLVQRIVKGRVRTMLIGQVSGDRPNHPQPLDEDVVEPNDDSE
jgi:hypothetical protein